MNKAVFIDRDGVINDDTGHYYIYKLEDFRLNENIINNICLLKKNGYIVIVISNQGGIGKGLYTKRDTDLLHSVLYCEVEKNGYTIDEIYYCPHHPDSEKCLCRKPNSLLIEKALYRFNINPSACYFIGDSPRDIEAAKNAGIEGILVSKNSNIEETCKKIIGHNH